MTNSQQVKEYYNAFNKSVMSSYRQTGNARIDKAVSFLKTYIRKDSKVLDIGCGVGIVPEKLSSDLDKGHIWAFDLSEENIKSASKEANSDKVTFNVADVINDFDIVKANLGDTKVELITLVDVVEHLPSEGLSNLLLNFASVSTEDAVLLMTYPTPEYQEYLLKEEPQKLQIIDESIDIAELSEIAGNAGFKLTYFSYIDVWQNNQYIHCAFSKRISIEDNSNWQQSQNILQKTISSFVAKQK